MKKVVVTGATGFLGYRTVRILSERGYSVLGLGRNVAMGRRIEQDGIPFIRCELSDTARMRQVFREVDYVVHCAALTRAGASADEYRVANILGTRNVMQAMQGSSVSRWIYISSARLYEQPDFPVAVRENQPLLPYCPDLYLESKRRVEIDVDNYIVTPTIVLRPQLIFGPGDRRLFPYLSRFSRIGRIPRFDGGDTMIDPIYVDNAVDAIGRAIEAKATANGKAYNISNGTPVPNFAFLTTLAETSGRLVKPLNLKSDRALRFADILEALTRFVVPGCEPFLPSNYVRFFSESMSLNIDAAGNDLSFKPKISLREAINFLNAHGRR